MQTMWLKSVEFMIVSVEKFLGKDRNASLLLKSLSYYNILDWIDFKGIADNKMNVV